MVKDLNSFPLRWGTRQESALLPLLYNIVLKVIASSEARKGN